MFEHRQINSSFFWITVEIEPPCFALSLLEERKQTSGLLALWPDKIIPSDITDRGFRLGHCLLGNSEFMVIQFIFEFYGFERYRVLINPNNAAVQTVLTLMVENKDYFFLAINPNQTVATFRSEIGQDDLVGLKTNMPQIKAATTMDR